MIIYLQASRIDPYMQDTKYYTIFELFETMDIGYWMQIIQAIRF